MQNAAARLIMDIGKYSHITPALYELHWLPVLARIHFKILLLAFKAIHGLAPAYISNLLVIKRKSSYNIRSNSGILLEPPRGKMLATLGKRAFQAFHLGCSTTHGRLKLVPHLSPHFHQIFTSSASSKMKTDKKVC